VSIIHTGLGKVNKCKTSVQHHHYPLSQIYTSLYKEKRISDLYCMGNTVSVMHSSAKFVADLAA